MPTFQHSELLPEQEILQYKIPTATGEANQCSDPEEKDAEHGTDLYQINDWKYCCKLLILRSARILARDTPNRRRISSRPPPPHRRHLPAGDSSKIPPASASCEA